MDEFDEDETYFGVGGLMGQQRRARAAAASAAAAAAAAAAVAASMPGECAATPALVVSPPGFLLRLCVSVWSSCLPASFRVAVCCRPL